MGWCFWTSGRVFVGGKSTCGCFLDVFLWSVFLVGCFQSEWNGKILGGWRKKGLEGVRTVWFSRRNKGSGQRKGRVVGSCGKFYFGIKGLGGWVGERRGGEGGFGRRVCFCWWGRRCSWRGFLGWWEGREEVFFWVCFFGVYFGGEWVLGETEEDGSGGFVFSGREREKFLVGGKEVQGERKGATFLGVQTAFFFLDTTIREGGSYFGIPKIFADTENFLGYRKLFWEEIFLDTKGFLRNTKRKMLTQIQKHHKNYKNTKIISKKKKVISKRTKNERFLCFFEFWVFSTLFCFSCLSNILNWFSSF